MKKTWTRLVATALILVLTLFVVACSGTTTSTTKTGATTAAGATTGGTTAAVKKDYSKQQVISFASIQIKDGADYNAGDAFVKEWAAKYNIKWDITALTWENWAERLRIWINSDDMPDMAVWNYVHGEAASFVDQKLVKKMPANWKTTWPNLAKAYKDTVMNESVEQIFGGTYYMFRPVFSSNRPTDKLSTHLTLYLRQDWGDAAGYKLKDAMTVSEIIDYCKAVKTADPGKVGANFYPLVTRSELASYFVQFNSTYSGVSGGTPFYKGADGKYQWGPASQDTLTGLIKYNQLYKDGLLHPEFYTLKDPDDKAAFYMTGKSAGAISEGMAAGMTTWKTYMNQYLNLDFDKVVRPVTVLGEDGKYHGSVVTNYWCTNIFSPHIEDAKLERIMDMMDYSCTTEGQLNIRMGIKGVDWETDASGKLVNKLAAGELLNNKYNIHPVYGNMFILSDDFQFLSPAFYQNHREKVTAMYKLRESLSTEATLPSKPDLTVQFHASQNLNLASLTYWKEYASLITKTGDIKTNWEAWVKEKMPMIQPVLDELNAKK